MNRRSSAKPLGQGAASALLMLALALCGPQQAGAQGVEAAAASRPRLQVGLGGLPGFGVQGGYLLLRDIYTVEGILSVDAASPFSEDKGNVLASTGLGGALRVFGIARTIGNTGYATEDLDVGLRLGPAFLFSLRQETIAEKNTRFRLFLESFVRFSSTVGRNRYFAELATHRPYLRAGVWFAL